MTLLGTDESKASALAAELSGEARAGSAVVGELVVLAVPYGAIDDVLARYGGQLDGKVLVDITNPVDFSSALGYLHMALQESLGTGFASAVKLLS